MKIGLLRPPAGIGGAEATMIELYQTLKEHGEDAWIAFDSSKKGIFADFINKDLFEKKFERLSGLNISKEQFSEEYVLKNIIDSDALILLQYRAFPERIRTKVKSSKADVYIYVPGKNTPHVTVPMEDGLKVKAFLFNSKETLKYHLNIKYSKDPYADGLIKKKFRHAHPPLFLGNYTEVNKVDYKTYRFQHFKIKKSEFSIGVVGRIQPSKRPFEALDIFKKLEKHYNYDAFPRKLYFYGGGAKEYVAEVKQYAKKLKIEHKVVFCGFSPDVRFRIKSMDSILHCCVMESLSRGIREAMVLKTPVVAYDGFGNRSLLGGQSGRLLYSNADQASIILLKIGTSGKVKRQFSTSVYNDIINIEKKLGRNYLDLLYEK